ncbi:MAG TPA: hypothetical protein ENG14_05840 [Thermodesulforhabdus norvegica]|uniref:Uncharacterized protein n=1 Tax=Thermodesulforhabdus norvegica TaxID=39841 RepID=A0A7C1AMA7_9BACT|nr:hypothetical protein [Thermodesulforhabdus norvegica]
MTVTPAEFGEVIYLLAFAILELLGNTFRLLTLNSVSVVDVWNVTYHAASFGYWVANSFVGEGGGLGVASQNVSAMKHFTNLVSYIGGNVEVIFGNETGQEGLSAAMREFSNSINETFSLRFFETAKLGAKALVRLMGQISSAFG